MQMAICKNALHLMKDWHIVGKIQVKNTKTWNHTIGVGMLLSRACCASVQTRVQFPTPMQKARCGSEVCSLQPWEGRDSSLSRQPAQHNL